MLLCSMLDVGIKDHHLKDKRCFELLNLYDFNFNSSRLKNLWDFKVAERPLINNACLLYVPS